MLYNDLQTDRAMNERTNVYGVTQEARGANAMIGLGRKVLGWIDLFFLFGRLMMALRGSSLPRKQRSDVFFLSRKNFSAEKMDCFK